MNIEEIQNFLDKHELPKGKCLRIQFKKRDTILGLFVKDRDYNDLKAKNFWRIVTESHIEEYNKSRNINLAKIFSGSDFAKLSVA